MTDQASNMKKAFCNVQESLFVKKPFQLDVFDLTLILIDEVNEKDKLELQKNKNKSLFEPQSENINENITSSKNSSNDHPKVTDLFSRFTREKALEVAYDLDEISDNTDLTDCEDEEELRSNTDDVVEYCEDDFNALYQSEGDQSESEFIPGF